MRGVAVWRRSLRLSWDIAANAPAPVAASLAVALLNGARLGPRRCEAALQEVRLLVQRAVDSACGAAGPERPPVRGRRGCAAWPGARILRRVMAVRVDISPFVRGGRAAVTQEQELAVGAEPVPGLGREAEVAAPAVVRVAMSGDARRIDVRVSGRLDLRCLCDRCLAPVVLPIAVDYAEEWCPRSAAPGRKPPEPPDDGPSDDEGVVRRLVAGPLVDCADGFWQNVAFSLPAKVLCAPGCRGLCPTCGKDLNRGACACREAGADPRLSALAAWRPPRA